MKSLLFNFAASYSGGGYKRLYEYARWFDQHGGATFIIHPRCHGLRSEFPANLYIEVSQSTMRRAYDDCGYLRAVRRQTGEPDLYYSYGIPIYWRFGKINWFHLSNVLPMAHRGVALSLYDRLRFGVLRRRIVGKLSNADIISAESRWSLGLMGVADDDRLFLSVNGSDDELQYMKAGAAGRKEDFAVVVGTYRHKALTDSLSVFEMLRRQNSELKLIVIGDPQPVPRRLRSTPNVMLSGVLKRPEVMSYLQRAQFYVSTTMVENSYNAASEGVCLADESYISDIGPHRELLQMTQFTEVSVPNVSRPLLHIRRADLHVDHLRTWDEVVVEMLQRCGITSLPAKDA